MKWLQEQEKFLLLKSFFLDIKREMTSASIKISGES